MRKTYITITALVLCLPFAASAAQFRASEEEQIRISDEVINENVYIGGGAVSLNSEVNGDVFIAGGQVDVDGSISDDLFVGSGDVRVTGDVAGDVRIGAGSVRIEGTVGGDLMIGAGTVEIAEGASVAGNSYIGTGQLVVAGEVANISAQTDALRVTSTAQVNGDLTYSSGREARVDDGATITGQVTRKKSPVPSRTKGEGALLAGGGIMWLITSILMILLFAYGLPAKSLRLAKNWKEEFLSNLGIGFLFLVVTPIAAILLLISLVGLPLGFITFAIYPIMLYLASIVSAIAVGSWVWSVIEKGSPLRVDWKTVLLGFLLVTAAKLVPGIGGVAVFVSFLAALGAMVKNDWNFLKNKRGEL